MEPVTQSGLPFAPVYGPGGPRGLGSRASSWAQPGQYPFTRGVYPTMYTGRPWTMRQYAGFGTAVESNARYKQLLAAGQTGLSVAFDLPTQMGYDSDHPLAHGEVGKVGVAIDSIDDMRILFGGIPLDKVSTSMTINAPAAVLLLLYQLVAEEQGVAASELNGTIQNDVLKEYIARGTYIYPPAPSLRLITDIFTYCRNEIPKLEHDLDLRLPHGRGRGHARSGGGVHAGRRHRVRARPPSSRARTSMSSPRDWRSSSSSRTTILEEVAKFRAARRMWARIMKERFGAKNPKSWMLRFHTQTAGVQLTAQQPEVNMVRVAVQGLAAALGGTQSLHTELVRRGHRPAVREGGPTRAAHPAGARLRDGCLRPPSTRSRARTSWSPSPTRSTTRPAR